MPIRKVFLKDIRIDIPRRKQTDNKTHGGKALAIAGSDQMPGALILCAEACARVGAGYVFIFSQFKIDHFQHPDFLKLPKLDQKNLRSISAIAIGPGLQNPKWIQKTIQFLLKNSHQPVVVDASALNELVKLKLKKKLPANWILTPHEGEMARLLKKSSGWVQKNRLEAVKMAAEKYGCLVLLKGHRSLLANGKNVFELRAGNPALAKAGTGDVLTGMILGFLSQGLQSEKAAKLAAILHGTIADRWLKKKNDVLSLMASDLVTEIPSTLLALRKSHKK